MIPIKVNSSIDKNFVASQFIIDFHSQISLLDLHALPWLKKNRVLLTTNPIDTISPMMTLRGFQRATLTQFIGHTFIIAYSLAKLQLLDIVGTKSMA